MNSIDSIIQTLSPFVTDNRKKRIEEVLRQRTNFLYPILENISDLGNIQAVMRTSESLGINRFGIVQAKETYSTSNRASKGSKKWLSIRNFSDTHQAISELKKQNYKIAVTHLDAKMSLDEIPCDKPIAVFFGNEKDGVSDLALNCADYTFKIPMLGFTESYNISVAAALVLENLTRKMKLNQDYYLDEEAKNSLRAKYYIHSAQNAEAIIKNTLGKNTQTQSDINPAQFDSTDVRL